MTDPTQPVGEHPTEDNLIRETIQRIQATIAERGLAPSAVRESHLERALTPQERKQRWGRYEFNLAEFPLFRFQPNPEGELVYEDEIQGKDGKAVQRRWRVTSTDTSGLGGESMQRTLFDLLQLFHDQGACEPRIYYKTVNHLLRRRGYLGRSIAEKNRHQIRRDLEQLCAYRVHADNAWWDNEKQAYGHARAMALFIGYFDYSEGENGQQSLFQSYIELSPKFRDILAGSNTFLLPFGPEYYHKLGPNAARLATYLSKMLRSQEIHRKRLLQLARQLPLEHGEIKYVKRSLKSSLTELHRKAGFETAWTKVSGRDVLVITSPRSGGLTGDFQLLQRVEFYRGADREQMVAFHRAERPKKAQQGSPPSEHTMSYLVQKMIDATGDHTSAARWTQFTRRMSQGDIELALEDLATKKDKILNRGALLNSILTARAKEKGITL